MAERAELAPAGDSDASSDIGQPVGDDADAAAAFERLGEHFEALIVRDSDDEDGHLAGEGGRDPNVSTEEQGEEGEEGEDSDPLLTRRVERYRDEEGRKIINQYRKVRTLAEGSTGKVKLYEDTASGKLVALKCVRKHQLLKDKRYRKREDGRMEAVTGATRLQREIDILAFVGTEHKHICPLLEVLDGPDQPTLYLAFPFAQDGQLMQFDAATRAFWAPAFPDTGCVPKARASRLIGQLADALRFLHARGVVHRDVKPGNILLSGGGEVALLSDFGCAARLEGGPARESGAMRSTEGTYPFFSPAMCSGSGFNAYAADAWALGVTMFAMLFCVCPFYAEGPKQLFDAIKDPAVGPALPTRDRFAGCAHLPNGGAAVLAHLEDASLVASVQAWLDKARAEELSAEAVLAMDIVTQPAPTS